MLKTKAVDWINTNENFKSIDTEYYIVWNKNLLHLYLATAQKQMPQNHRFL